MTVRSSRLDFRRLDRIAKRCLIPRQLNIFTPHTIANVCVRVATFFSTVDVPYSKRYHKHAQYFLFIGICNTFQNKMTLSSV